MVESTITNNGQTTIPPEVRQALKLVPRQRLEWFILANGTAIVRPLPLELFPPLDLLEAPSKPKTKPRKRKPAGKKRRR